MATAPVLNTNFVSGPRENIRLLIENKNNVVDPTTSSSEFRKWVYSREPDIKSIEFKGYPYIVISGTGLTFGDEQTGDARIQSAEWGIEIEVVTSDREFNNREGKGLTDNDSISDDIMQTLNSSNGRFILRNEGLRFIRPNLVGPPTAEKVNNTLIFRRSFIVGMKSKKKVY